MTLSGQSISVERTRDEGLSGEHVGREVSELTTRGTGLGIGMGFHLQMVPWRTLRP